MARGGAAPCFRGDDVAGPTVLSLFSGVGGLDLAIKLVWPEARVLGYCERDAYAAGVLLARMEDEALECAPVWCGDIQDMDASSLRGRVDIVCGGFPCQDISVAGKGGGLEGARSGLFYELMRVVREVGPRLVYLENVSALTFRGLDRVLGELADSGFDAEWLCLRASDVGAPHRRERWFCLAHAKRARRVQTRERREINTGREPASGRRDVADPVGRRRDRRSPGEGREQVERAAAAGAGEAVADAERTAVWNEPGRRDGARGSGAAVAGDDVPVFPPGPGDHAEWRKIITDGHLDYRAPATQPGVRVLVDGLALVVDASRADQLRCCGNGVVPLQAAAALVELVRRIQ
jgi:DNA (cytosine-5)-methyltransferase 1